MAASLPNDILRKIIQDRQIDADTQMELEKDLGAGLFKPLQISDDFKEKLTRVHSNRVPVSIGRFEWQMYKNGKLTVIRKLGCPNMFYQLPGTWHGKPTILEYEATKYFTKNARTFQK